MNYQSNFLPHDAEALVGSPPYHVKTPDVEWAKMALLRMVIGYSSLFLTRAVSLLAIQVLPSRKLYFAICCQIALCCQNAKH